MKHLVAVLQPLQLKSAVEDALRLEKSDLKDEFFGIVYFFSDEAEICERFQPLRDYRESSGKKTGRKTSSESSTSVHAPKSVDSGASASTEGKPIKEYKGSKSKCKEDRAQKKDESSTRVSALLATSQGPEERQTATSTFEKATAAQSKNAVVMADLCYHVFACRIDSGEDELGISDSLIRFLYVKSVFLPTRNKPRTFKAVDGRILNSPGELQITLLRSTQLPASVAYGICVYESSLTKTLNSYLMRHVLGRLYS